MKTYRINKYAERLAQGTGFAPELIYNISLVRFQGRNGRCIAAWTPGIKRPRYVYKAHTPEEYDKAMERIRQEAERFRRHACPAFPTAARRKTAPSCPLPYRRR